MGKLWVLVFVVSCAVEQPEPVFEHDVFEGKIDVAESELCTLAAQLPDDNVCSQICDPELFKAALIAAGYESGRCYLLACELTETVTVGAAACVPP